MYSNIIPSNATLRSCKDLKTYFLKEQLICFLKVQMLPLLPHRNSCILKFKIYVRNHHLDLVEDEVFEFLSRNKYKFDISHYYTEVNKQSKEDKDEARRVVDTKHTFKSCSRISRNNLENKKPHAPKRSHQVDRHKPPAPILRQSGRDRS